MKRKWMTALMAISIAALSLTGCNKKNASEEAVTELSKEELLAKEDEQNKIIAEYAAGVLMKYNAGTNSRVLEGRNLLVQEQKEEAKRAQEEKRQQLIDEYNGKQPSKEERGSDDASVEGGALSSKPAVTYVSDLAAAAGLSSFTISYSGYEITNSYGEEEDQLFFSVDAGKGRSLVVAKFMVTNISSETEVFDLLSLAPEFKLKTAGKSVRSYHTLLLNDLSAYRGEIASGESVESVIVFELPNEVIPAMDTMEMTMKIGESVSYMSLEQGMASAPVTGEIVGIEDFPVQEDISEEVPVTEEVTEQETAVNEENTTHSETVIIAEEVITDEDTEVIITTIGSNGQMITEP